VRCLGFPKAWLPAIHGQNLAVMPCGVVILLAKQISICKAAQPLVLTTSVPMSVGVHVTNLKTREEFWLHQQLLMLDWLIRVMSSQRTTDDRQGTRIPRRKLSPTLGDRSTLPQVAGV
jgi:hypothetical protein